MPHSPLRLILDGDALVGNWRWCDARSGDAACGAAVKANGYGVGAAEVVRRLRAAGCRDFFVATWVEAAALAAETEGASLAVLHGLAQEDVAQAATSPARPVLNTVEQVRRWKSAAPDRPCDVMIDTGIGRLGLSPEEARSGLLDGLAIDTLMSHLACADDDTPANPRQRELFEGLAAAIPARRRSLANSAGLCLGRHYAFDLTRPGLALYGGVPRREAEGHVRQVAHVEAQVVQVKTVPAGSGVGYNATWHAPEECRLAILNIGYADGYLRGFSSRGRAWFDGVELPVVGRVSMDLTAIRCDAAPSLGEGEWVEIGYDLAEAAAQSGLSQYEVLTTLGSRHARTWR